MGNTITFDCLTEKWECDTQDVAVGGFLRFCRTFRKTNLVVSSDGHLKEAKKTLLPVFVLAGFAAGRGVCGMCPKTEVADHDL